MDANWLLLLLMIPLCLMAAGLGGILLYRHSYQDDD